MMGSYIKKKIEFLVVDTSAFINKAPIQELAENVLTVPQVINEIKSKRQLRRLTVLPYDLSVKEAFPENVKFVTEFSKKTGDYASLSVTDINIIALTYQIEREKNGVNHLKSVPVCRPTVEAGLGVPEDLKKIAGFYLPNKECVSKTESEKSIDSAEEDQYDSAEEELEIIPNAELQADILNSIPEDECSDKSKVVSEKTGTEESEEMPKANVDAESDGEVGEESEDNESESEWITLDNLEKAKNQIASELNEDLENVNVACLTTDFAMQNVLKQIGLNVISIDGKLIKQLRTFILRCYGCFKTTSIMTKVFCPNCGNKTLKKVGVSVDENGSQKLHINFRKPLTAKGKRYSMPHFKGGKHSNNPVICEDQPMPQQRASRLSRTKNNPLNDDYIAGYSPFVTRDVTSKSAMLGIRPHLEMKHWMRNNPNESRKKKK